jgi:hypothetical protein
MGAIVGHGYGSGTGMDTFTLSELQVLTAQHMFLSHLEYDIYTQLNLMAFNMLVKQT